MPHLNEIVDFNQLGDWETLHAFRDIVYSYRDIVAHRACSLIRELDVRVALESLVDDRMGIW